MTSAFRRAVEKLKAVVLAVVRSAAAKRAIRTLIQACIGGLSAGGLDQLGVIDPGWVPVVTVMLTGFLSQLQNELEDREVIPTYLK